MSRLARERHRSVRGASWAAVALVFVTVATSGCSRQEEAQVNESMTLMQAKAETQELERSIVDAFPSDQVAAVEQRQEGVLLSCSDDQYQWTGGVEFTLAGDLSDRDVAERVVGALESKDGWSSEVQDWKDGGPTAIVSGPQGLSFIGNLDADRLVTIASASRCFTLSEDQSPFSKY
jgi:hypothetical protein